MKVNWKSLVGTLLALQALGFVWYGPLFGQRWMELEGLTTEQVNAAGWAPIGLAWLTSLAVWWVFSKVFAATGVSSAAHGAMKGLFLGVGLAFMPTWMNHAFGQRDMEFTLIVGGYAVLMFVVAGAIVGASTPKRA